MSKDLGTDEFADWFNYHKQQFKIWVQISFCSNT